MKAYDRRMTAGFKSAKVREELPHAMTVLSMTIHCIGLLKHKGWCPGVCSET